MKILIWLILLFIILGLYFFTQFRGLKDAESMEYAQLARNMSTGKGYITSCIRPSDIWYFKQNPGDVFSAVNCQDIRNPPFFPAVLSLGFKLIRPSFDFKFDSRIFEPETKVIIPVCIFFTIVTGLLVYLTALQLFNKQVAGISTMIFFLSKSVLDDSISGLPDSLMAFLATAACYTAVNFRNAEAKGKSRGLLIYLFVSTAILSAAAFLTSYKMVVLAPVVAFFMVAGFLRRGLLTAGMFLVLVCLMISPWVARNWKVSGGMFGIAPYSALQDTVIHKDDSFDRQVDLVPDSARNVRAVKMKFMSKFTGVCEVNMRTVGNGLIICLFLVSVFHKFEREDVNHLKWSIVAIMLQTAVAMTIFTGESAGAFKSYLPLIIIYGVAFFFTVLERDEFADAGWKMTLTGGLLLVSILPVVFAVSGQKARLPYPPYFPPFISYVSNLLGTEENMCTDIPWATAWYGRRTSVLLPQSVDDFMKIHNIVRISGLYLTTVTGNKSYNGAFASGPWRSWLPILNGKVPKDFPLPHGIALPKGTRDQLFLTDKNRWAQDAVHGNVVTGTKK
ncbi:MAG: glycosyltransferase family 39 protein [Kiritimatiellae bacterium]|nr:glycosyltransferase family 39 protein [Kiritimatiellia bacterium]